ncbi:hypothetical protein LguiA_008999 [Lonicera macranthoides]
MKELFADKQIVKLQETPDEIPDGGIPHTVSLLMHDKLVDAGKPDDEVKFSGPEVHLGDRGICGGSRRQCKENMKRVFTSRGDDRFLTVYT